MSDIVEQIVNMAVRSGIRSVEVTAPGIKVKVRRKPTPTIAPASTGLMSEGVANPTPPRPRSVQPSLGAMIRSQRVGIFHHLQTPVDVGHAIQMGQILGVIESMRVPSDVRATCEGLIAEVLVEDGSAVEYDQPLFVLFARRGDTEEGR